MRLLLFFALTAFAGAQPFSAGIKVGAPVTDTFKVLNSQSVFAANNSHFIIGPTAEVRLPFGFGIEVDALHRSLSYSYNANSPAGVPGVLLGAATSAGSWEFPVLAKFRGGLPLIKPYGVAGLSFNHLTGIKQTFNAPGVTQAFNDIAHNSNVGVVVGGGVQINVLLLKISPELRFTRWGVANFNATGSLGSFLKSNQNQADVLIGFTF